ATSPRSSRSSTSPIARRPRSTRSATASSNPPPPELATSGGALLRALERATLRIGYAKDATELHQLVLDAAHDAVGFDSASLMTVDPPGDALVVRTGRGDRLRPAHPRGAGGILDRSPHALRRPQAVRRSAPDTGGGAAAHARARPPRRARADPRLGARPAAKRGGRERADRASGGTPAARDPRDARHPWRRTPGDAR